MKFDIATDMLFELLNHRKLTAQYFAQKYNRLKACRSAFFYFPHAFLPPPLRPIYRRFTAPLLNFAVFCAFR